MIIRKKAYPRAGLIGNPSDGYHGKTIAFAFTNFHAEVVLYETPDLEILPNTRDHSLFRDIHGLVEDVGLFGYYGGIRLLKASIKRFHDYCAHRGIELHERNFTIRYSSNIPHLVGLAGSSAIITACFRALMAFYGVSIPKPLLANLILSVETEELGISAGLQDRVAQVYQGMVYMDFNQDLMRKQGHGHYEYLASDLLPPVYVAYRDDLSEVSSVFHNNLRERFNRGEPAVLEAIRFWMDLTDQARIVILQGSRDPKRLAPILNANFDKRASICQISEGNLKMVQAARSVGASSKFTGSGGAVVGTYEDESMFRRLVEVLEPMKIKVVKPVVAPPTGENGE